MSKALFVEVILPLAVDQLFTYSVPANLSSKVEIGKRAVVQFGKQKIYTAIIAKVTDVSTVSYPLKEIIEVLDDFPVITQDQFKLWDWISRYYICSMGEVMTAALPSVMKLQSETAVSLNTDHDLSNIICTPEEQAIIDALSSTSSLPVQELSMLTGTRNGISLIRRMIDSGTLMPHEEIKDRYKAPMVELITLCDEYKDDKDLKSVIDSIERKAPRQFDLMMAYLTLAQDNGEASVEKKLLLKRSGVSSGILTQLVNKNVFSVIKVRDIDIKPENIASREVQLTPQQNQCLSEIKKGFGDNKVVLLHGVTSSGKTEIYARLISEQIASGKQVLYLLPEIALTTQIIQRLQKIFGDQLMVYHSRHNQRERATVYLNILNDGGGGSYKYPIIVGARSAVYLPFKDLGLVIVDEEHESSYKQFDPAPRYHARDTAVVLGQIHKSNVLLGSATPSLESYQNAMDGKYALAKINGRFGGVSHPTLTLVDLAEAYKRRQVRSHFSNSLLNEIDSTLKKGEQVILFQNRRGFAPVLQCSDCGSIPHCINCDVSLTYHKRLHRLSCHYCGYHTVVPTRCVSCNSNNLKMKGMGTERIEDEITVFFPETRVERLDLDTSSSKAAFQKIMSSFEAGEIEILVGTQMITKGLDFGNVGLVGILNADNLLNFPDFRASERSFQLMAQVAGRAGRRSKQGKVIVQTFSVDHPVLKFLLANDYVGFYNYEIHERSLYRYPPFYRMIEFRLRHRDEKELEVQSKIFADMLRKVFGKRVLGPVIPMVSRIRNYYIRTLLLKMEKEMPNTRIKEEVHKIIDVFHNDPQGRKLLIHVDVDPY